MSEGKRSDMKRLLAIGTVITLLPATLLSQTGDARQILDKVKRAYDNIKDAELEFSQQTVFEISKTEHQSSGRLFIKKQNKYRVEQQNLLLVTDGVTVWSYNPANKQVLIDKFKIDERSLTPERVLTAAPKDYYSSILGKEKVGKVETILLKLVPKDEDSIVRVMKVWVDESNWLFRKVEIEDVNGRQTTYIVSDIKVNIGIPDSRFTYQVPNGVEAVDLR